jgi:hypothetical protein
MFSHHARKSRALVSNVLVPINLEGKNSNGEGVLAAARKIVEGTRSPRDFDRSVHRRLQLRISAKHAPLHRILSVPACTVNRSTRPLLAL